MAVLPRFDSVMSKVTHAAHVKASCFDVSHSLSLCLLYNKLVIFSHDVLMMTPSHSLMGPSRLFRHTAHIGHAPVGFVCSIQPGCIPAQLQLSDKVNVSANFPKAVGVCSPTCSRHSELTFPSCLHLRGRVAAKAGAWGVQCLIHNMYHVSMIHILLTLFFFYFHHLAEWGISLHFAP